MENLLQVVKQNKSVQVELYNKRKIYSTKFK